jgi:hypothetical protein
MALITSSSLTFSNLTGSLAICGVGLLRLTEMGYPNKYVLVYNDQAVNGVNSKICARVLDWNASSSFAIFSGSETSSSLAISSTPQQFSLAWASGSRCACLYADGNGPQVLAFDVTASQNIVTWVSTVRVQIFTALNGGNMCSIGGGYLGGNGQDTVGGYRAKVFEVTSSVNATTKAFAAISAGSVAYSKKVGTFTWIAMEGSPMAIQKCVYDPVANTVAVSASTTCAIGQNAGTFVPTDILSASSDLLLSVEGANSSTTSSIGVYMNYYRMDASNTYQSLYTGGGTAGGGFQDKKAINAAAGAANFTGGTRLFLMNPAVYGDSSFQTYGVFGYDGGTGQSRFNKVLMNHKLKTMTMVGPYTGGAVCPGVSPVSPAATTNFIAPLDDDDMFLVAYSKANTHGLYIMKFNAPIPSQSLSPCTLKGKEFRGIRTYRWKLNV